MGKRSEFSRISKDYYPTPKKAVLPLLKHLPENFTFIEPCAGDYRLVNHIENTTNGICLDAYDVEPRNNKVRLGDALDNPSVNFDLFITNPPWDRKLLHPVIKHLSSIAPTWLLFDADWAHTKQSVEYIKHCKKIVSIGRVKWFEETNMTGKDNCCWYLFDVNFNGVTEFIGR